MKKYTLILFCFIISLRCIAQGDQKDTMKAEPKVQENKVIQIYNLANKEFKIHVDDIICIQTDSSTFNQYRTNYKDSLRIWIDGICFNQITPIESQPANNIFIAKIIYDSSKASPWQTVYAYPYYKRTSQGLSINLGTKNKPFKLNANTDKLGKLFISLQWMQYVGYILFLIILIMILKYGKGILRDKELYSKNGVFINYEKDGKTDPEKGVIYYKELPISLAGTQFLFWLLIIFFGIIHIWCFTDTLASPTGTVLILLGISSGTFYIAKLIDTNHDTSNNLSATDTVKLFQSKPPKSKNPIVDILNDGNGISLHRLQLLMFTLFLGIYFIWQMLSTLSLPQFSDTMLLLMGISSTTYAGIKTQEK